MSGDVTQLLQSLKSGDRGALDALLPLVYDELRRLARRELSPRKPEQSLDTTDLLHEAYLRLFDQGRVTPEDRRHFFALAARAMRQVVIDRARRRQAMKRGGDLRRVDLESSDLRVEEQASELIALDEALTRLGRIEERLVRVVELRFFAGFTVDETAGILGFDPRTVRRDWEKARAILYRDLAGPAPGV
jgi:RNA polymerase sigma factor (TIGR02999 family)